MSRFTASGTLARIDLGAGATFDKVATSEINAQQTKVLMSSIAFVQRLPTRGASSSATKSTEQRRMTKKNAFPIFLEMNFDAFLIDFHLMKCCRAVKVV